jgi:hypothetical protein
MEVRVILGGILGLVNVVGIFFVRVLFASHVFIHRVPRTTSFIMGMVEGGFILRSECISRVIKFDSKQNKPASSSYSS